MKNLLIYVNPKKEFDDEHKILAKIQIDNSLELGWKKEDIVLATNFDYEYKGVKSIVVGDDNFCSFNPLSTKTVTVIYLIENGMIEKNELYWVHDLDAYQLEKINEQEIGLDATKVGLTTYGWSPKWCLGSYFFRENSKNFFKLLKDKIYDIRDEDERALVALTKDNVGNINDMIKVLNISYQFGMRNVKYNYRLTTKPIKVIHFHPSKRGRNVLDKFMYGKNEINKPLMTIRLINIFQKYDIK